MLGQISQNFGIIRVKFAMKLKTVYKVFEYFKYGKNFNSLIFFFSEQTPFCIDIINLNSNITGTF